MATTRVSLYARAVTVDDGCHVLEVREWWIGCRVRKKRECCVVRRPVGEDDTVTDKTIRVPR